jgi:ribose 1,5-bisphosphokinase
MQIDSGIFVLVVGPSGAGKDSVLNGARTDFADDERFVFVQRTITRESGAGFEDNVEATPGTFAAAKAAGAFALFWRAHDLDYGIPVTIEDDLRAQRCVIANVSRSVIELARARYAGTRVVNITAPLAVLARRIALRGREDAVTIEKRLARAGYPFPTSEDIVHLKNTGTVEEAVDRFTQMLRDVFQRNAAST